MNVQNYIIDTQAEQVLQLQSEITSLREALILKDQEVAAYQKRIEDLEELQSGLVDDVSNLETVETELVDTLEIIRQACSKYQGMKYPSGEETILQLIGLRAEKEISKVKGLETA